jgi:hypothetical protein
MNNYDHYINLINYNYNNDLILILIKKIYSDYLFDMINNIIKLLIKIYKLDNLNNLNNYDYLKIINDTHYHINNSNELYDNDVKKLDILN